MIICCIEHNIGLLYNNISKGLLRTITKAKFWRHRKGITSICNYASFSTISWKVNNLKIIQDDQESHCFDEWLQSPQHHHPYQQFVSAITSQIKWFYAQSNHLESNNAYWCNMHWNNRPTHKMMGPPLVKLTPTPLTLVQIVHTMPYSAQWCPRRGPLSDIWNPTRLH